MWLPWEWAILGAAICWVGSRTLWRRGLAPGGAAFLGETALVAALYAAWQYAGRISIMRIDGAMDRARSIWDLERAVGLPNEATVQSWFLDHDLLIQGANVFYGAAHVPGMGIFLFWMWFARNDDYGPWRTALAWLTACCLAIQLFPVAPPRLVGELGVVDTGVVHNMSVFAAMGSTKMGQLQAMPSIHIAWAALIAWAVWEVGRGRWRWLGVAHLGATSFVVVVTGNHYWLDGIVAVALLVVIRGVQRWLRTRRRGDLRRESSVPEDEISGLLGEHHDGRVDVAVGDDGHR